jgi:hypothetical protein
MSQKTLAVATLIASTSNAAGSNFQRGTLDCRELDGGVITMKVTNGGTGPTLPCQVRVLMAHDTGATPTAAAAGTVWKTRYLAASDSVNSSVREFSFEFNPGYSHIEVEMGGNTGQAVTVEAMVTTYSYD